jgi:hypothetical protein
MGPGRGSARPGVAANTRSQPGGSALSRLPLQRQGMRNSTRLTSLKSSSAAAKKFGLAVSRPPRDHDEEAERQNRKADGYIHLLACKSTQIERAIELLCFQIEKGHAALRPRSADAIELMILPALGAAAVMCSGDGAAEFLGKPPRCRYKISCPVQALTARFIVFWRFYFGAAVFFRWSVQWRRPDHSEAEAN